MHQQAVERRSACCVISHAFRWECCHYCESDIPGVSRIWCRPKIASEINFEVCTPMKEYARPILFPMLSPENEVIIDIPKYLVYQAYQRFEIQRMISKFKYETSGVSHETFSNDLIHSGVQPWKNNCLVLFPMRFCFDENHHWFVLVFRKTWCIKSSRPKIDSEGKSEMQLVLLWKNARPVLFCMLSSENPNIIVVIVFRTTQGCIKNCLF